MTESTKRGRPLTPATGSIEWRHGHAWVKVSLPDGTRPRYPLCKAVVDVGHACTCTAVSTPKLRELAAAVSERKRAATAAEIREHDRLAREKRLTVQRFGESWTSGELFKVHGEVRRLRVKKTAKNDAHRLKAYVYPEIGGKAVADVTEQDIERLMAKAAEKAKAKLGRPWRQAAKFQLYQVLRRLFELSVKPGRLRSENPVSLDLRPARGTPKLFGFLYPSELLTLLGCKDVPVGRRVLYALAVYTGLRKGSLYALTWNGIDFQHRTLTSLESKTGLPQLFEIDATLSELLQRWHERQGKPKDAAPVVSGVEMRRVREAEQLRLDLEAAGIKRDVLLGNAPNVEPLRFHDLRATFVTWAIRQGRGEGWIVDRTGHLTPAMRERYQRAARTLADLDYAPFPPLTGAIPELSEDGSNVLRVDFKGRSK